MWWNRGKSPPRLKKWIELEQRKEEIIKAVEGGDDFPSELFLYLSTALGVSSKWYEKADWYLIIQLFYLCLSKSPQLELPLLTPSNEKSKEESWDYPQRTWHLYSHLLAKNYGWTLEEISQLHVEEALAKIQEIIVEDQLDKEFIYGLSEIAYSYDKNSKTSKFVPLPRPHWMRPKVQPVKKFIIPASMLPIGNVITEGVLPPELMPKEIH
jgi:hypothetical protein